LRVVVEVALVQVGSAAAVVALVDIVHRILARTQVAADLLRRLYLSLLAQHTV
jgi:hypothetical protein